VILPGHNDKKAAKSVRLIQVALRQAGIETPCEFTWQSNPFFKNCLSAHKYDRDGRHTGYHRPAHLKDLTAVHVSLTFEHPVPGPIVLGAGRHCGFGLMAINL
jgi:CRISPR-associated protein Csb2